MLKALIIGGAIPATLWAVTGVFQKLSAQAGTPPTVYVAVFGLVLFVLGSAASLPVPIATWNSYGVAYAALAGISFAVATGALSYALWAYAVPISKLAPLLNTNVVILVLVGILFLGEGANVNNLQLLVGAIIVVLGATIAVTA